MHKRGAGCDMLLSREPLVLRVLHLSLVPKVRSHDVIPGPQSLVYSFTEESVMYHVLYEVLLRIGQGGSGCQRKKGVVPSNGIILLRDKYGYCGG